MNEDTKSLIKAQKQELSGIDKRKEFEAKHNQLSKIKKELFKLDEEINSINK